MGKSEKENKRNNLFSILGILGKKGQKAGGVERAKIGQEWVTCDECGGSGWVSDSSISTSSGFSSTSHIRCRKCKGRGRIIDDKSWMRGAKKVGKAANVAGGVAKAAGGAAKGFMGSLSSAGGGGGGANLKKIALFLLIGFIAIMVILWFLAVGGGQAVLPGIGVGFQLGWERIMQSYSIRSFMNMVKNPFGVGPTGGQYEDTSQSVVKTPPNQAFSIELRGVTERAILDQETIIAIVRFNNLGSSRIQIAHIELDLRSPFDGAIKFNSHPDNRAIITEIAPFSSKEVVFSGGYLVGTDIAEALNWRDIKPDTTIGGIVLTAKARTYYPTSSRLAIERIKTDYGTLLIKNNILRQSNVGAVYRAGSAMTIDMGVGHQPILDSMIETGLLIKWQNVGSGKMPTASKDGNLLYPPYLFIISPKGFGPCNPSGYIETTIVCGKDDKCINCDQDLLNSWCNEYSAFYTIYVKQYAADLNETINWACNKIRDGTAHVCATTSLTEEFNIFSCKLDLPGEITTNETRITDYVTTVALYPYEVTTSKSISAFCLSGIGVGSCPTN